MRAFKPGLLLLFASCSPAAFGQAAQTPTPPGTVSKVAELQKTPATAEDMAIAEVVLSDVVNDKQIHGMALSGSSQIVVFNKGYENFKPSNPNIVMSDLKDLSAALEKARSAPDYMFEIDYTVSAEVYKKLIPNARAIVDLGRPAYSKKERATLFFNYGPLPHGRAQCTYTLAKKRGQWKIVKRQISIPM